MLILILYLEKNNNNNKIGSDKLNPSYFNFSINNYKISCEIRNIAKIQTSISSAPPVLIILGP